MSDYSLIDRLTIELSFLLSGNVCYINVLLSVE